MPNGTDYQFGDPNQSKLRPYRQSTVRPAPEPVRTVMDQSRLLVQASSITCRLHSPLILRLPTISYRPSFAKKPQQSHFLEHSLEYFSACYENYACHTQIYTTFSTFKLHHRTIETISPDRSTATLNRSRTINKIIKQVRTNSPWTGPN